MNKIQKHLKRKLCDLDGENLFNDEFVPNYNSKEIIDKFYNAYLYNLRISDMEFRWVKLDDIEKREVKSWHIIGDKFLKDTKRDRMKLAEDLIENGTYWPIYLSEKIGLEYPIKDGLHRVWSLQQAQKKGIVGPDKKVLAVIRKTTDRKPEKKRYKLPSPLSISSTMLGIYFANYRGILKSKNMNYTDSSKLLIFDENQMGETPTLIYSLLLRNAIFEYNQSSDTKFKGAKVINDEEAFYKWRGSYEES